MALSATFSELLGYTSIACWLGAQFPQVLENARRQSVDGLALPFLMNWLLGDVTNLVGCILTRQLPFQTWLATYFVFVDFSLLSQYFYYRRITKSEKPSRPPYLHSRDRTTSVATRRLSFDRGTGAPHPHYRALSNVAANVAATAALAAQQEERWHSGRSHSIEPHPTAYEDEEEISEEALARLADSFHSEGGRSGRRKHVVWGQDSFQGHSRHSTTSPPGRMRSSLHMTAPPPIDNADMVARGRAPVRAVDQAELTDEEWLSGNANRRSSRASRKGATMVFLGVWALFGVGSFMGGQKDASSSVVTHTGRIWTRAEVPVVAVPEIVSESRLVDPILSAQLSGEPYVFQPLYNMDDIATLDDPVPSPTLEHIIGRISAWICTTLYLTSRLPQIWKNYVRKSVEGLSIYLFIFAFLGNFFYVASILASPNFQLPEPEASAFLRESIPYLLGSGGTLMFDITIVTQSLLYQPKAPSRGRGLSRSYSEEEAGLLSAAGVEGSPVAARRRAGSVSRESAL